MGQYMWIKASRPMPFDREINGKLTLKDRNPNSKTNPKPNINKPQCQQYQF